MRDKSYTNSYLYQQIVQAKLFIDTHFNTHMDVDSIAGKAYFSKFHFIRLFKKTYGKTPHQYLIRVRIQQAKQLLETDKAIGEVCFLIGFESISSFTGLFKRMVGITPAAYQAKQLALKHDKLATPLKYVPGCYISRIN